MGASRWEYFVPFEPDLASALTRLHQQVIDAQEYFIVLDRDEEHPASREEILARDGVEYSGTHSILDIDEVIEPDGEDGYATLRPLTEAERLHYFGTTTPAREDFERAGADDALGSHGQRWSGYSTVLYQQDVPVEIAIWGSSGD